MNIHEHQAKQILKKYGANVPEGVFAFNVSDLLQKTKELKTDKYVLKAQIHAGGRGTIVSPCPPITIASISLTGKFNSSDKKSLKRELSKIPAIPTTLFAGSPEYF